MAATALQLNPESIAVECYQGNVQELTDVITHHLARFRRIALGHLSNVADAEDAVQDALLSALTHVHQFRGQAKMSTWLTTIVINSARMKLRRRLTSVIRLWMKPMGNRISWRALSRIRGQVRKRNIASEKLRKHWLMQPPDYRPLCAQPSNCATSMA